MLAVSQLKSRFVSSYAVALGLIVLFSVFAHLATLQVVNHKSGTAEVINVSGKQRTLTHRLWALAETQSGLRSNQETADLIHATREELLIANAALYEHARTRASSEVREPLVALFEDEQNGILALMDEFKSLALGAVDGQLTPDERQRLEDMAIGELYVRLHHAVGYFEADAEAGLQQIGRIQIFHFVAIIAILLGEALFIFFPLLKRTISALTSEQEARKTVEDALKIQTETLASKSRFLHMMSNTFLKPLSDALEHLELASEVDPEAAPQQIHKALNALRFADQRARSVTRAHADWVRENGAEENIPKEASDSVTGNDNRDSDSPGAAVAR